MDMGLLLSNTERGDRILNRVKFPTLVFVLDITSFSSFRRSKNMIKWNGIWYVLPLKEKINN